MSAASSTPELESVDLTPAHAARVIASRERAARSEAESYGSHLAAAAGAARRLAAAAGMSTHADVYGDHCRTCEERYALAADRASCPHKPICEDCWPNGCEACEAQVDADLRRRDVLVHTVTQAAEALEAVVLDLTDSDLAIVALDLRYRTVLAANVARATEALRQIGDRLKAKSEARP